MMNICAPALIYLIFSLAQIMIDTYNGLYNTAFMKCIVMVMVTFLLNAMCLSGLSVVSWVIVFIPFILMTVIVTMLLYVLGLDIATGKINNKDTSDSDSDDENELEDVSGVLIIDNNNNGNISYITPKSRSNTSDPANILPIDSSQQFNSPSANYKKCDLFCSAGSACTEKCESWNCPSPTACDSDSYTSDSETNTKNYVSIIDRESARKYNSQYANNTNCDLFCSSDQVCTKKCKSMNCPSPTACDSEDNETDYDNSNEYADIISKIKDSDISSLSKKKKCDLFCLPEVDSCTKRCRSLKCPFPTACNY